MTKKEHIMSILQDMGYSPTYDDDGDICLIYQMKAIYFMIHEDNEDKFLGVLLPQFCSIEEGEESLFLTISNKLTRDLKLVKVFVDSSFKNITASCEFYYADDEQLKDSIQKSLAILGIIRREFTKAKKELTG